jgi:hypothetical protein
LQSSAWLRAVPAWAWLVAIVAGSTVFRALAAREMPGPFIFVDELIYSELAKSFAAGGHFLVRDVPTSGYGVVYPVLISPAYRLFDNLPTAYAAVKTINSLAMSLAAVPAYLLARRMLTKELALFAALLTVAVPSMVYTGTVMTENVFYGLFLLVTLVLVAMLERPTVGRQAALLVLVVAAYLTRAQSLAFAPAVLVAPVLLAFFERRPLRSAFARFAVLYGAVVAGGALLVVVQVVRGRSLGDLLGAYSVVSNQHYGVRQVADFTLWHAADLSLYVGVIPLAASILLVARARRETREVQSFLAAAIPLAVSFTLVVAAFATRFASDRIHERNLFQLTPLLFIGLLVWVSRHDAGAPRSWPLGIAAVAAAAVVPLTIPYSRFIGEPVRADTLALLPVWTINRHFLAGSVLLTVGLVCGGLGALVLLVPRRAALALPVVVLAWFALLLQPVFDGPHGFKLSSAGAVFQGIRGVDRDWIDDAVPKGARVAALWSGRGDRLTINESEFFNRSVGQIYYDTQPTPGGLYEKHVIFGKGEVAHTDDGRLVRPRYLLVDGAVTPDGVPVARDLKLGMTVWRLHGPLVQTTTVTGVYADYWSGPRVSWTRRGCRGGTLRVTLYSDANFFVPTTVVATGGVRSVTVHVARVGVTSLRVPIPAHAATCVVRFLVSPVRVPKVVTHGSNPDPRSLGTHFSAFDYRPAS